MNMNEIEKMAVCYKPGLNKASSVCSGIVSDGIDGWDDFIDSIKSINRALAQKIEGSGINFWVLYNDSTCASGWHENGLQVDIEEWYMDDIKVQKIWEGISNNNQEQADKIRDYLDIFCSKIIAQVEISLKELGINFEQLDALSEKIVEI